MKIVTINVTQDIIDKANNYMLYHCIGALVLKEALKDNTSIDTLSCMWGYEFGSYIDQEDNVVIVTTKEKINLSIITQPLQVTIVPYKGERSIRTMSAVDIKATTHQPNYKMLALIRGSRKFMTQ